MLKKRRERIGGTEAKPIRVASEGGRKPLAVGGSPTPVFRAAHAEALREIEGGR